MMPVGLKISLLNRMFGRKMDEKSSFLGLTSAQMRVLGSLSRLESEGRGEIHQIDLERLECVTHPAMTKLLRRLESKGFVRCIPSERDHRYKRVVCTEKSAGIHHMIMEHDEAVFSELCRNLTEEQKQEFLKLLDLILQDADRR